MAKRFSPGNGPFAFEVRLEGDGKTQGAVLRPPFDVPEIFGTRARVPVRGTINGAPFRSSLCNMGAGHMMVVNRELRAAAGCKAGDRVRVVMERDTAPRVVALPSYLRKIVAASKTTRAAWERLSFTRQKEWVRAIEGAKQEETRRRRIGNLLRELKGSGK